MPLLGSKLSAALLTDSASKSPRRPEGLLYEIQKIQMVPFSFIPRTNLVPSLKGHETASLTVSYAHQPFHSLVPLEGEGPICVTRRPLAHPGSSCHSSCATFVGCLKKVAGRDGRRERRARRTDQATPDVREKLRAWAWSAPSLECGTRFWRPGEQSSPRGPAGRASLVRRPRSRTLTDPVASSMRSDTTSILVEDPRVYLHDNRHANGRTVTDTSGQHDQVRGQG
jgi:hypothetical protein